MGACDFITYAKGQAARDAFATATDEARYEHGAGGYSGSIAEKGDFVVLERTPLERSAAEALAARLLSGDDPRIADKWGPAGAIPVAADDCFRKRTVTQTLVYKGDHTYDDIQRFVRGELSKIRRKDGETIGAHRIVRQDTKYKIDSQANEGKAEIRYFVKNAGFDFVARDWERGFKTLAEARAATVEFAKSGRHLGGQGVQTLDIVAETRRDSGASLVTVTRTPVRTEITVEVEVIKPTSFSNVAEGWLFIGWASS